MYSENPYKIYVRLNTTPWASGAGLLLRRLMPHVLAFKSESSELFLGLPVQQTRKLPPSKTEPPSPLRIGSGHAAGRSGLWPLPPRALGPRGRWKVSRALCVYPTEGSASFIPHSGLCFKTLLFVAGFRQFGCNMCGCGFILFIVSGVWSS